MSKRWSELDVIKHISETANQQYPGLIKGIGDDCAVIATNPDEQLVITSDMLVEGVHFDCTWHPPYELGRKSIAVNLSDIASMGGIPRYFFISICLPDRIEKKWINQWLAGVDSIAQEYGCCLAGGDTVRGNTITINVTLVGAVATGSAILRSSANPGQSVYVSGELGSATAGLKLFQNQEIADLLGEQVTRHFKKRHLDPGPAVKVGQLLSATGMVTSMQDISDGIATDLSHICTASGIGAVIDKSLLPCHPELSRVAEALKCDMFTLMVAGGEDFHLVFTVEKKMDEQIVGELQQQGVTVYRIGKTIAGKGVYLRSGDTTREISYGGFEH